MPLPSHFRIVMPSHNYGAFVARAIESILNQTHKDWSLHVVDNGSTDNSLEVIRSFKDPRITVTALPKNIYSFAGSQAVAQAASEGDFVCVQCADDAWVPTKLERQLAAFQASPEVGACFSDAVLVDREGEAIENPPFPYNLHIDVSKFTQGELLKYFFEKGCPLFLSSFAIRSGVLKELGTFSPLMDQIGDMHFHTQLIARHPIMLLPEPLIHYRIHGKNESSLNGGLRGAQTANRICYEQFQWTRLYAEEPLLSRVEEIWPDCPPEFPLASSAARLYHLGHICLGVNSPAHRHLGLSCIREALRDDDFVRLFEAQRDEHPSRYFYALTGNITLFHELSPQILEDLQKFHRFRKSWTWPVSYHFFRLEKFIYRTFRSLFNFRS